MKLLVVPASVRVLYTCLICAASCVCTYVDIYMWCMQVPTGNTSSALLLVGPGSTELQQPRLSLPVRSCLMYVPQKEGIFPTSEKLRELFTNTT